MASHPAFDPLRLDMDADALLLDPASPLLNRAAQGLYPPGEILLPLFRAAGYDTWPEQEQAQALYESLGFFHLPEVFLPVADVTQPGDSLLLSPLQLVRAAAAISNEGLIPALRLVTAVNTPEQGWVILPADGKPVKVFQSPGLADVFQAMHSDDLPGWQWSALVTRGSESYAWSLAGTLPGNQGTPLTVVVLLEEADLSRAEQVSMELLKDVLQP
jgi:hypothetical protein